MKKKTPSSKTRGPVNAHVKDLLLYLPEDRPTSLRVENAARPTTSAVRLAMYEAASTRELAVVLFSDPEGGFTAEVPSLPGCFAEGETLDEALDNARGAATVYLDALRAQGRTEPSTPPVVFIRTVTVCG